MFEIIGTEIIGQLRIAIWINIRKYTLNYCIIKKNLMKVMFLKYSC